MASARLRNYLLCSAILWSAMQLSWCQTKPLPAANLIRKNSACRAAQNSCSACLQIKGCAWCIPNTITDVDVAVCQSEATPCENGTFVNPKGTASGPGNNAPSKDDNMALTTDISRLSLRVGEPHKVELTLKVSSDGGLDLYYLTDLSLSMQDDLTMLSNTGDKLLTAMENKTKNFKIGFGTFIDKKILPYYDTYMFPLREMPNDACQKTYSFCNSLALTKDGKEKFRETVGKTTVGNNKDGPEGGLDALMQVLVCEEAIGWTKNALKIILYASDDDFHYSGDGKLAGIDKINDGKCHINSTGEYTEGLTQDYPSVAQIAQAAKENNIHVIFAVVKKFLPLYRMLTEFVPGSRATELASDSSNIIDIVTEQFDNISKALELRAETLPGVDVSFEYDCPSGSPGKCEGLQMGQTYKVTAEITLTRCPADVSSSSQPLVLNAVGLNGNVTIDLDYICSCDCEKPENSVIKSPQCNNTGTYTCGMCTCPAGVYGRTCSCSGTEQENTKACTAEGQAYPCSGQGRCICNSCECQSDFYGPFCECEDKGCALHGGKECNGHGVCKCKECECHDKWTGDNCNCSLAITNCYRTDPNDLCSGHGTCECNSCKCDYTGRGVDKYFGKYCQDCPTCGGECTKLAGCVQCHLLDQKDKVETGVTEAICQANHLDCADANMAHVKEESQVNTSAFSECHMQKSGCSRSFFYRRHSNGTQVILVGEWYCPLKWWEILLSVVVPMVALGLLTLLIWYCIHTRNLRLELEKVEKDGVDALESVANMNNLYRDPVSQMHNPLFGQAL